MSEKTTALHRAKRAPVEGLLPTIAQRWSPRSFLDQRIPAAAWKTLLEAARWAPSSSNAQPWRFLVGVRSTVTFDQIYSTLAESNQVWAGKASALVLGYAATRVGTHARLNSYALYDLGAAAVLMTVQAEAMGLATHQMGGYDQARAREIFGLGEEYLLGSVMAIGYLADPEALGSEQLVERELAERTRRPLEEIAFAAPGLPFDFGE